MLKVYRLCPDGELVPLERSLLAEGFCLPVLLLEILRTASKPEL